MATTAVPSTLDIAAAEAMPEEVNQLTVVTRRFLRHRLAVFSLFALGLIVLIAVLAPAISPFDPTEIEVANKFASPGSLASDGVRVHYLGTDTLGRDYFARLVFAARIKT